MTCLANFPMCGECKEEGQQPIKRLVSCGQTVYFDMGAEKNKGLVYYGYMFCAENRQILAIADWPLIGVNIFQRHSNDAYELL